MGVMKKRATNRENRRGVANFEERMNARGDQLVENTNKALRSVAERILKALIESSPVDRGHFIGNWKLAFTKRPPKSKALKGRDPTGAKALRKARRAIDRQAKKEQKKTKPIFIVNSAPHRWVIRAGRSKKARKGWLESAVDKGLDAAKKVRLLED